jgi:hypothetical protein
MIQRNERLSRALKGGEAPVAVEVAEKPAENETESEAKPEAAAESESALKEKEEAAAAATKTEDLLKSLDQQLVEWNQKLVSENKNLHQVIFLCKQPFDENTSPMFMFCHQYLSGSYQVIKII